MSTAARLDSATATPRRQDLARDERGAVMLTGVFMGCFLIGATWFIFGIARAAIFRERVQEAADAAAFSSAAIHAKGMNLIAAINLVFFAVTSIWLVLRVFEHVMAGVQTVLGNSSNCHGFLCHLRNPCEARAAALAATGIGAAAGASVCRMAYILQEVRDVNKEMRQRIGDQMDRFFPKLSRVQDVTARLAPAAGAATGVALGAKFGHLTFAISPSAIPVDDLVNLANRARGANKNDPAFTTRPLGLPVVPKKFGSLCGRAANIVVTKVVDAFKAIPIIGTVADFPVIKEVISAVTGATVGWIENEFCSDNDWAGHNKSIKIFKEKGPKGIFGHAENGNDLMQVWAFTNGIIDDRDAPKVAIAGRKFGQGAPSQGHWYIAQAEFYYDCNGAWGDAQCNGSFENVMYNMKWRARLRRLRTPDLGAELGRYLRDALFSGPVKDAIKEALKIKPPQDPLNPGQNAPPDFEQRVRDGIFDQGWGWLNGKVTEATGVGNSKTGSIPGGSYH